MDDPNDYVIVKKRKKYKFALFRNSPLCFEFEDWKQNLHPDVVEIGAGDGLFMVELASKYPEKRFVAIDVKGDRLQKGAMLAEQKNLTNILFLRARADQLVEIFQPNSLMEIWLTFSDPFPKKRSAGRRLTHPRYLDQYASLLNSGGSVLIKHDDSVFFQWSLEQLVMSHWHICELSFVLHESELDEDYKFLTSYERRWINEGRITQFVRAIRRG